jgi:hypothetical protein
MQIVWHYAVVSKILDSDEMEFELGFYMMIPVASLITNYWKKPYTLAPVASNPYLMMAGIFQTVFLNQWGAPEFRISLARLGGFFRLEALFSTIGYFDGDCYSVWIYEKRNKVLFFRNTKLLFHFRWDEFKEKWKRTKEEVDSWLNRSPRASMVTSLSYVN